MPRGVTPAFQFPGGIIRGMRARVAHIIIVLIACAAVYWPLLGATGFGSSEGHRVGPAWEMLDTGDWTQLRLFGLTYLRKPPGMPWAIAISSSVLGQTEFAARAVSALASTVMALVALWFTNRWLGRPWGLAGGLAQALTPLFVSIGRTAEIDALNTLCTQIGALALLSLIAGRARFPNALGDGATKALLPGAFILFPIGVIMAGVVKGPASLPVLLGIPIAACLQARSVKVLGRVPIWIGLVVAGVVLGAFAWWFATRNVDPQAVTQDFSEFTWSFSRLAGTAALLPNSFVAALPTAMALVVLVFQRWEKPEIRDWANLPFASLLGISWVCSVVLLMVSGSSNPRYAMPAAVLLPPLAAWALRACWRARHSSVLARIGMLGHPVVPAVALLAFMLTWMQLDIRRPRHTEGRIAGAAIAAALPDGAEVWANDLVEARPDVLLYAELAGRSNGRVISPRWKKSELVAAILPDSTSEGGRDVFMLLREDAESSEVARYADHAASGRLQPFSSGRIAKYEWTLFRVREPLD